MRLERGRFILLCADDVTWMSMIGCGNLDPCATMDFVAHGL